MDEYLLTFSHPTISSAQEKLRDRSLDSWITKSIHIYGEVLTSLLTDIHTYIPTALQTYIDRCVHNRTYLNAHIPTFTFTFTCTLTYIHNTTQHRCPLSLPKFRHQGMIKSADASDQLLDRDAACLRWIKFVALAGRKCAVNKKYVALPHLVINLDWGHKV